MRFQNITRLVMGGRIEFGQPFRELLNLDGTNNNRQILFRVIDCFFNGLASVPKCVESFMLFPLQSRFGTVAEYHAETGEGFPSDLKMTRVSVTFNHAEIVGWHIKTNANKVQGFIVFYHGNFHTARDCALTFGSQMAGLGYDSLWGEYPGYGESQGNVSCIEDILDVSWGFFNKAIKLKRDKRQKVFVGGYSVGTGISAYIAKRSHDLKARKSQARRQKVQVVDALLLLAPYYSLKQLSRVHFPVPDFMLSYDLPSCEYLQGFLGKSKTARVFIAHARNDEVIPYQHGQQLFVASCQTLSGADESRRIFLTLTHPDNEAKAGHTYIPDNFFEDVDTFFSRNVTSSEFLSLVRRGEQYDKMLEAIS